MERKPMKAIRDPKEMEDYLKKILYVPEIIVNLAAFLYSIVIYLLVAYIGYKAIFHKNGAAVELLTEFFDLSEKTVKFLLDWGGYAMIILFAYLAISFVWKLFNIWGIAEIYDIPVSAVEIDYDFQGKVAEISRTLGLKYQPIIYFSERSNAYKLLGVPVYQKRVIFLPAEMIQKWESTTDFALQEFYVCRELAHIYLHQYDIGSQVFTFPARVTPILKLFISRMYTYATDCVCLALMGEERVMDALLCHSVSDWYLLESLDMKSMMEKQKRVLENHWFGTVFIKNFRAKEPILAYRLRALLESTGYRDPYRKDGGSLT